jgi:hypothetical protein
MWLVVGLAATGTVLCRNQDASSKYALSSLLVLFSFRFHNLTTTALLAASSSSSLRRSFAHPVLRNKHPSTNRGDNQLPSRSIAGGGGGAANKRLMTTDDSVSAAAQARLVYGRDDALFGCIEKQQSGIAAPFGSVLDAGTGLHSLRWLATLCGGKRHHGQNSGSGGSVTDFVAVTADATMQRNCQREIEALGVADCGRVILGNWFESQSDHQDENGNDGFDSVPSFLQDYADDGFHVILADYLIGAMDGFSPYQQDVMIPKLTRLLKPGGRLYIVGLEPIPDSVQLPPVRDNHGDALLNTSSGPTNTATISGTALSDDPGSIICRVRQVRDACILLAGHRCYREYPIAWVRRQIQALPDIKLCHCKQFPILYRHATIVKQINVGRSKLPLMPSHLRPSMEKLLDDLEAESLEATTKSPTGRIQFGFDYVVTAEKVAL